MSHHIELNNVRTKPRFFVAAKRYLGVIVILPWPWKTTVFFLLGAEKQLFSFCWGLKNNYFLFVGGWKTTIFFLLGAEKQLFSFCWGLKGWQTRGRFWNSWHGYQKEHIAINWFSDSVQVGIFVAQHEPWIKMNENLLDMWLVTFTAQKRKFSIKDFFSKCGQIRSFLRICSHLLKKSLKVY